MHELSIVENLIDAICDELPKLGPVTIRAVRVRIGAMSGVEPEVLAYAFEVASEESPIAGSHLYVDHASGRELELIALEVVDADPNPTNY